MKKRIPVSEIAPGMVLAESVVRRDGAVLFPEGATFEKRHLRTLEAAGVEEVVVREPAPEAAPPGPGADDPMLLEAARDYLSRRFAFADLSHEPVAALFELCLPRTAARMAAARTVFLEDFDRAAPGEAALTPREAGAAPRAEELLRADLKLVSLPDVFVRINEVVNNPRSTAEQAAAVIGKDPSLSAKLLKIVNSAFYGLPSKVDGLSRAVTIVGGRQLTTLALGVSVLSLFKDLPPRMIDVRSLWKHSICCGLTASALAAEIPGADPERAFTAGMLHDVGRFLLYKNLPGLASRALIAAREERILLHQAERDILGWDHALLAGMLLTAWNFPSSLEQAVRGHHDAPEAFVGLEASLVHAADVTANALAVGSSGEFFTPPLSRTAWETLGLPAAALARAAARVDLQIGDIFAAFLPS